jgi:hypothetical protein
MLKFRAMMFACRKFALRNDNKTMQLKEVFEDKSIKAKAKVAQIGDWLLNSELPLDELILFAESMNGSNKATCIEAVEYATKKQPTLADEGLLAFVTKALDEEEPRIKWESAKVIGNVAKLFPAQAKLALHSLLVNAEHSGTVVRWATAYALAEILKMKMDGYSDLKAKIEALNAKETDNAIQKKYLDALKKVR